MKIVYDNNNVAYEEEDSVVVKTIDGKHYYVTEEETAARDVEIAASSEERELQKVLTKRVLAYGSYGEQLDIMYHEGFQAWSDHISEVKLANPLPE